jgi:DNA-binding transcriptional ArsR family regulator
MAEAPSPPFESRLAALSQPTRLRIVEVVANGGPEGTAAGRIARAVHCPASTLSFHLKELSQAGLLEATPDGRFIRYSVKPKSFADLAAFISALPGRPAKAAADETPPRRQSRQRPKRESTDKRGQAGDKQESQLSIFDD